MNQSLKGPMDVAEDGEEIVTATAPKAFTLMLPSRVEIRVPVGTQEMPRSIAEHWYAAAHGVSVYVPKKPAKAEKAPEVEAPESRPTLTVKKA